MKFDTNRQVSIERSNVAVVGTAVRSLSLNAQKTLFDTWATDVLNTYRGSEPADRYSSLDEYLSANAFFVTATFHRTKMAARKWNYGFQNCDTSLEMDAFHNLYHLIARRVLGNHWDNPSRCNGRILAIVAMDHPEAKFGRTAGSVTTNLHWHAIMVARSGDREALASALSDPELIAGFRHRTLVDSFDAEPWLAGSNKDYLFKAFVKSVQAPNAGIDDLRLYPKPGSDRGPGWGYLVQRNHVPKTSQRLIMGLKRELVAHELYGRRYGFPYWEQK